MENRDLISSLFWMAFGILFCLGALQYGFISSPGVPGPGCLPFLVGMALISLSLGILFPALFKKRRKEAIEKEKFFPQRESPKKILIALASLLAYAFFLEYLGYLLATFLFLIFVLRCIEPQRWKMAFTFAFITAIISFALFRALKVELPKSFWGI